MGKRSEDYDWLDEAFDDKKNEEDYLAAKTANNRGCLIALAVGVIVVIVVLLAGFGIAATLFAA